MSLYIKFIKIHKSNNGNTYFGFRLQPREYDCTITVLCEDIHTPYGIITIICTDNKTNSVIYNRQHSVLDIQYRRKSFYDTLLFILESRARRCSDFHDDTNKIKFDQLRIESNDVQNTSLNISLSYIKNNRDYKIELLYDKDFNTHCNISLKYEDSVYNLIDNFLLPNNQIDSDFDIINTLYSLIRSISEEKYSIKLSKKIQQKLSNLT